VRIPTFTVDLEKKCVDCNSGGAQPNGLCFGCISKAIQGKPMKTTAGRTIASAVRCRLNENKTHNG
jgi:hypothetical protein